MPSISYKRANYQNEGYTAYSLELRPPRTDRMVDSLCDDTTIIHVSPVNNTGNVTRLRVESPDTQPYDIATVASYLGQQAYNGEQVELINLDERRRN